LRGLLLRRLQQSCQVSHRWIRRGDGLDLLRQRWGGESEDTVVVVIVVEGVGSVAVVERNMRGKVIVRVPDDIVVVMVVIIVIVVVIVKGREGSVG
jgi:hypothetical protein